MPDSSTNFSNIEFISVINKNGIPSGERIFLEIDKRGIVLFNVNGDYFAVEDVCSHDQNPLGDGELRGFDIHCPRHGASFDIRSGNVTSLPATSSITCFPVRLKDDEIQIGIPRE